MAVEAADPVAMRLQSQGNITCFQLHKILNSLHKNKKSALPLIFSQYHDHEGGLDTQSELQVG